MIALMEFLVRLWDQIFPLPESSVPSYTVKEVINP
jgi:hypothetical protein